MSRFRVKYPVDAFDGGLNSKYQPSVLLPTESPDCLNVVFDDRGSVATRLGSTLHNTTAVGSFAGDGLFTTRFDAGTQTMIGFWNGTAYANNVTTFVTIGSAQSIWTAGERVDMKMYQDIAFFGNGNTPYKWTGLNWTRHGINVPNSLPSWSSNNTAASVSGDNQYKISYVNSFSVEGDVSSSTATITVTNKVITLTSLPVAPTSFGVAARKIYRKSGGNTTYKLVATVNDNTTTTYADEIADASLGADAPTDNGQPPNWKYCVSHGERLWFIDPTSPGFVYYTDLGNPFVVGALNFKKIGDGDGEQAIGLSVHADSVMVHKSASVWAIYTGGSTDEDDWKVIKTNSRYGSVSHYSIVDYSNLQMFLGKRYDKLSGFLSLAGLATVADRIDLTVNAVFADTQSDRIEPDVFLYNHAAANLATGIEYKNKLWFAVPYGLSQTSNNRIYQFDYQRRDKDERRGSWVPFTGLSAAAFTIWSGNLYYQDANETGRVFKLEVADTYSDNGVAIDSYYWTAEFGGKEADRDLTKDWRYAIMTAETLGDWFMGFTHRLDADSGSGTRQRIDLNPGGSIWGTFIWGVDLWGGGQSRKDFKIFFPGTVGTRIQLRFDNENTVNQAFKVLRCPLFYNLRGIR